MALAFFGIAVLHAGMFGITNKKSTYQSDFFTVLFFPVFKFD